MSIVELLPTIERGGMVALTIVLWWLERAERLKLAQRLDDCLETHEDKRHQRKRGQ